jgi:hypothetical protein
MPYNGIAFEVYAAVLALISFGALIRLITRPVHRDPYTPILPPAKGQPWPR